MLFRDPMAEMQGEEFDGYGAEYNEEDEDQED
jgi:hypothetical protein